MTTLELAYPGMPLPKFATVRDWAAPTLGTLDGKFARIWLGQSLMPWQQYIADLSGELLPNGLPRYGLVVVTVQRQAGKSHLDMAQSGCRCFSNRGFRSWYTAQTGQDARDQFLKFHDDVVADTPLDRVVKTLRGNGHEVMRFPNKSAIRPHPPTEKALHGKQSDRNSIDEGWAFDEEQGAAILQAISPTQLTRPAAQTVIWSAGGTANSTWLAELVARGRGGDPSMCYVEFGIPDDMSVDDTDGILRHHPAYGHTLTRDSLLKLRSNLPDDSAYARAAGNRWTEVIGGAIPWDQFTAASRADDGGSVPPIPQGAPMGWGAARAVDGSQVVIACAATVDGRVVVEIVEVLPTAYKAAAHVLAWAGTDLLALDPSGSNASLSDDLDTLKARNVRRLSGRETTAAVSNVVDGLPHRAHLYRPSPELDSAVKVAGKRLIGEGGYVWSQVGPAPIAALNAATYAIQALTHRKAPEELPVITFAPS